MRNLLISLSVLFIVVSCELRPLYINDNGVEMTFNLNEHERPAEPLICVRSYAVSTGTAPTSDFVPLTGGLASIPAGNRMLFAHTFGSETVVLENESSSGISVRTNVSDKYRQETWNAVASLCNVDAETASLSVCNTPDHYYVGTDIRKIPFRAEGDDAYTITLSLKDVTHSCIVRLTNIKGLDFVSSIDVFLTGCRASLRLDGKTEDGICVINSFAGRVVGTDDICSSLRCFGRGQEMMSLYFLVTDIAGNRFGWMMDAGTLIEDGTAVFDASSFEIKEPVITGKGFYPTLTDWDEDIYNIYL